MMSIENIKNTIVFGFDSAWTDKVKGAICYISFDADGNQNFCEPKLASFAEATDCILTKSNGFHFTLIALALQLPFKVSASCFRLMRSPP